MSDLVVDGDALEVLLDWLYCSESSEWTCPGCGAGNGGAYRLFCKYCAEDNDQHPMRDQLHILWKALGREVDDDGSLVPPETWGGDGRGQPPRHPPQRWAEYLDKYR